MDALEYAKAKQLRKIVEAQMPSETVVDFTVKKFANGKFSVGTEGTLLEIAALMIAGMRSIEQQYPEARYVFEMALREYMEELK